MQAEHDSVVMRPMVSLAVFAASEIPEHKSGFAQPLPKKLEISLRKTSVFRKMRIVIGKGKKKAIILRVIGTLQGAPDAPFFGLRHATANAFTAGNLQRVNQEPTPVDVLHVNAQKRPFDGVHSTFVGEAINLAGRDDVLLFAILREPTGSESV